MCPLDARLRELRPIVRARAGGARPPSRRRACSAARAVCGISLGVVAGSGRALSLL